MPTISVYVVDDNLLLRDGLKAVLESEGFAVVGAAASGEEALRAVSQLAPQVLLVDSSLGDRDSLQFIRDVQSRCPGARVIVMGFIAEDEDFVPLIRAGAHGFIMKNATIAEFSGAIRSVAAGHKVLPSHMTSTLFSHVAATLPEKDAPKVVEGVLLTRREQEIVEFIAIGLSNKEIADRLGVTTHTVKSHVHNILEKLTLRTRLEVAAFTRRQDRSRPVS